MECRGFCAGCKKYKKNQTKRSEESGVFPLTNGGECDTMIVHTVIVCLSVLFLSNTDILPHKWGAVKCLIWQKRQLRLAYR